MRNTEERLLALKLRAKEIEDQKRTTRRRILSIASFPAALLVLVVMSFAMPGLMASMPDSDYGNLGTLASIFARNKYIGFILIGFLAFTLGVGVTILSYKIKQENLLEEGGKEDRDNGTI